MKGIDDTPQIHAWIHDELVSHSCYRCFHCQTVVQANESHNCLKENEMNLEETRKLNVVSGSLMRAAKQLDEIADMPYENQALILPGMTRENGATGIIQDAVISGSLVQANSKSKESTSTEEKKAEPGELPSYLAESQFKFGRKSNAELVGVHPELVKLAALSLFYSRQDFMVFDGLRTESEQRNYVRRGVSKTMRSKHRKQADGMSHAIDLVPVVGVLPKWDWELIFPVVAAVDYAATEMGIADNIRWGGAWDRTLADFGGEPEEYRKEIRAYAARHAGRDFLDGPHFEWRE